LALRRRQDPAAALDQAALLAGQARLAAQIELALVEAFAWGRSDPPRARAALDRAGGLLELGPREDPGDAISPSDRACLFARWIDQEACPLNKPSAGPASHRAACAV
jgi:hypothetical protein